ncbi:MAG: hypothetical protein EXX96DRAFT_653515 [Benjaminiella poitrasii]|nr:MAG: hypothetical protein EXX96DRAFT_653515 [Benjaminiella poitrasii]
MKENKFMMGEEEESSKTTNNATDTPPYSSSPVPNHTVIQQHKRPVRHHVKRRSSGRVHVTKLAPMARANGTTANHTDSEADLTITDDNHSSAESSHHSRPVIRRSQSQRSLHKMSFERKGLASFTSRRKSTNSAEKLLTLSSLESSEQPVKSERRKKKADSFLTIPTTASSSNPASLSSSAIAAPIEQPLTAVAHNLVFPKQSTIYPKFTEVIRQKDRGSEFQHQQQQQQQQQKKPLLLCSRFLVDEPRRELNKTEDAPYLDLNSEYQYIKSQHDPMQASLLRCIERLNGFLPKQVVTRTVSSSNQASSHNSTATYHLEQRQLAHRHHQLLRSLAASRTNFIYSSQQHKQQSQDELRSLRTSDDRCGLLTSLPWNPAVLLDKILSITPSNKTTVYNDN